MYIKSFVIWVIVTISLFFTLIFLFNVLLIKTIKATSKIVTKKTLQMQLTFYRSTFIESIFLMVFQIIVLIGPAFVMIGVGDLRLSVLEFSLFPCSVPISYILTIFLIRPYREFILKALGIIHDKNRVIMLKSSK